MKKRIAHVTFDMRIGGAEQVISNMIENSDKTKYEISIICIEKPIGPFGRQLQEKGYKIISFNRKPGFDITLIKEIRNYINNNTIDILHCHQYTPYIYGLLASMYTSTRIIFTEHGRFYPDQKKLKRILLNPILHLFTDNVTAISSATRDALVEFENFPRRKIKIVYNGIGNSRYIFSADLGLKQSLGINQKDHVLGTVARLDPIKNHKMMIRSLKIIHNSYPDTYLLMVGDGPERENLTSLASRLGLSKHVIFTGFREDVHLYLKVMNIFLITSFSEGTAMTLLEAMAASLPCIATDVGGNPEIVKDGETGFVIPSDDEKTLAETIRKLLDDDNMMEKMGKASRKRFEENFTVDKMVAAYEEIYDKLAHSS